MQFFKKLTEFWVVWSKIMQVIKPLIRRPEGGAPTRRIFPISPLKFSTCPFQFPQNVGVKIPVYLIALYSSHIFFKRIELCHLWFLNHYLATKFS